MPPNQIHLCADALVSAAAELQQGGGSSSSTLVAGDSSAGGAMASGDFVVLHTSHSTSVASHQMRLLPHLLAAGVCGPLATVGPLNALARSYLPSPGSTRVVCMGSQPQCDTTQPLWAIHDESGRATCGLVSSLAALLHAPAWGIDLGSGILVQDPAGSWGAADLAAVYAAAVCSVQLRGPYILLGVSPASCVLAHAVACALEGMGQAVALILLDGCPTGNATTTSRTHAEHLNTPPTHYALYATAVALQDAVASTPLQAFSARLESHAGLEPAQQIQYVVRMLQGAGGVDEAHLASVVRSAQLLARRVLQQPAAANSRFHGPVALAHPEDTELGEGEDTSN
jgi:thioesterase domain-containing protein